MDIQALRRNAQVALAVLAVLAAVGAGFRYLVRGGSPFGQHVVVTPASGPIGMRPFFEFPGYKGGQSVTVYLCAGETGGVEDCANLGTGKAGERLRGKPIPKELPDTTEVLPGEYVLRAGPDAQGEYPKRGGFDIVAFKVGSRPRSPTFDVPPSSLAVGKPERVATSAPCRPPLFLADGRLAVGSTVVDPTTGVTIQFDVPAQELAWSPVGDKLAILTSDRKEIRMAAPDGSGATVIEREARGLLSSMSWSPEGDRLAYIAQPDPATTQFADDVRSPTVRIVNATTGAVSSAGAGLAVSWSPNKDLLAVEMAGAKIEASTPEGGRRALTSGRRPGWSPDGRYLTVVRTTSDGSSQGWVVPVQGSGAAPLGGEDVCALSFSPAGTHLAIVADNEGKTTLFLRTIEKRSSG
jgi:WD40 repeat protein